MPAPIQFNREPRPVRTFPPAALPVLPDAHDGSGLLAPIAPPNPAASRSAAPPPPQAPADAPPPTVTPAVADKAATDAAGKPQPVSFSWSNPLAWLLDPVQSALKWTVLAAVAIVVLMVVLVFRRPSS